MTDLERLCFIDPANGSSALDEETARAELYGVLSQLYYAPPSPELLSALRVAVTEAPMEGGFLQKSPGASWGSGPRAGRCAIAAEYDRLFGGVGKPEVFVTHRTTWRAS